MKIHVDLHGVPDELREYEPDLIATEAFVREMYRTLANWYEDAYSINPELTATEWFQDFETALRNAEQAMAEADIDSDDTLSIG